MLNSAKVVFRVTIVAMIAMATVASAEVYTFEAGNPTNWYSGSNAMTVVEPGYAWVFQSATLNGGYTTALTDRIQMRLLNTGGGPLDLWAHQQGVVPCGAEWVAPVGEVITKVELAGSYRSDYGTIRYRVSGGTETSTDTVYLEAAGIEYYAGVFYGYGGDGAGSELVAVDIPIADGVTKVQMNPYVLSGGAEYVIFPAWDPTYQGIIRTVRITTESPTNFGHAVLINRGFQLQALSFGGRNGYWSLDNWYASNFSTINTWFGDPTMELYGEPGTFDWGVWCTEGVPAGFTSNEMPYADNLVSMQYGDETASSISDFAAWRDVARTDPNFVDVLLYTNQYRGQLTESALRSYVQSSQPDMICFDVYPFGSPTMTPSGGSPTAFYSELSKYRTVALEGYDGTGEKSIPFGVYTQTWVPTAGGYFDIPIGYQPSESEIRLNHFSALTFGSQFITSFVYDDPPLDYQVGSLMFTAPGVNPSMTSAFNQVAETARQCRRLGRTLVLLKSTDLYIIEGANSSSGHGITSWPGSDSYISSISVTNMGTQNGGVAGDVLIGYFEPVAPWVGNPMDEIYFMITNGLSSSDGSAYDCLQKIEVQFAAGITSIQRVNRETGNVETLELNGGSLELILEGGTGDLFKFNTGQPFIGQEDEENVYHFTSSNPDWYSGYGAMTIIEPTYDWVFNCATTNGGHGSAITNQIGMRLQYADVTGVDLWTNEQGIIPCGAEWVAPVGELITKVELAGYYRSDNGTVRYRVSGGSASSTETVYWETVGTGHTYDPNATFPPHPNLFTYGTDSGLVAVEIPIADGVTKVQLNPYVLSGGTEIVTFPMVDPSYRGSITDVRITTESPVVTNYVFNDSVDDWYNGEYALSIVEPSYASVFNAATTNGGYSSAITNQIRMRLLDTTGTQDLWANNQGIVPCGAGWLAPPDERIVRVELSGAYRSDNGTVRYQLQGWQGADTDPTQYLQAAGTTSNGWQYTYDGTVVDIPYSDNVQRIELNPYVLSGGSEVVSFPLTDSSYHGEITGLIVTTQSLLGPGGLEDFATVSHSWMNDDLADPAWAADMNTDGEVDLYDLTVLVSNWLGDM